MRAFSVIRCAAALGVAALLAATALPAHAAPVSTSTVALKSALAGPVIDVRSRGWRGGGRGAGVAAGIASGLIIGGIIASQRDYYYGGPPAYYGAPVYYPPGYYGPIYEPEYGPPFRGPGWASYCFSRYRSFDPVSGTYVGYDGRRHYCR